jgi:hypothetical protein
VAAENETRRDAWRIGLPLLTLGTVVAILVAVTVATAEWRILLLKLFLVAVLSFLPGWLYLQFIGLKGWTLYDEYVLNLHRLGIDHPSNLPKPPPGSPLYEAWRAALPEDAQLERNIYLKRFESVYGESAVPPSRYRRGDDDRIRRARPSLSGIRRERFGPVLLATAVLTVGWVTVLQPEIYGAVLGQRTVTLLGVPELPAEPLRAGFLGAYVFVLQSLVRRYYQQDLKSRAYVGAVLRIVVVAALVVALHPLWQQLPNQELVTGIELAFAFLLGFFPELGVRLLVQRVGTALRRSIETGESQYPLRELDGCNLYAQARLLEEGVEDMENLTSANIVDLLLDTRTPVGRLVDWMDQAFLYLRVTGGTGEDGRDDRALLRQYGVRTATDLCDLVEAAHAENDDPDFRDGMLRLLNAPDDGRPSRMLGIYHSLQGETNLWHLRRWKRHEWLGEVEPPGQSGGRDVGSAGRPDVPPQGQQHRAVPGTAPSTAAS